MKYKVVLAERAIKQLKKLDRNINTLILGWIEKNIQYCEDPRRLGKGLAGDKSGQWRYRVGDYRLICEIKDEEIIVIALEIGHRKNIYKK